jgi:hypothetical protein
MPTTKHLRWMGPVLLAGALSVSRSAVAAPGDYLRLTAEGLMTAPLEISIDLETGDAIKRSKRIDQPTSPNSSGWSETKRQLSSAELHALKAVIKKSLAEGLRSKRCDEQDALVRQQGKPPPIRPPIMDSMISLSVQLDGATGGAPERECTSPAFDALWDAAYNAASASNSSPAT